MAATTSAPERVATPAATSATPPAPRFAGLDGLRAIAVVTVMLFHLAPGALPGGFLGVDIFFVISGFLITSLLLAEHASNGRIRLGHFWRRRARRLLPALGVLLLVCCTAAWLIGSDLLVGLGQQVLGATTFSSNWLAVAADRSYFDETTPELLRNLWSLAVEEQFYLLWPLAVLLLLLLTRRRWLRVSIVAVTAIASAVGMALLFVPGADATRVYYGTDTHSFGLALGAVLALIGARWSRQSGDWHRAAKVVLPLVGLVAVAALVVASFLLTADGALAYQGGLAVVAVLSAIAILGSIVPGSYLGRALDRQPLRWIGERSYGLYLWHWPVFILVIGVLPTVPRVGEGGWMLGGIAAVITVLAATVSYRFVEQPIRRHGFRGAFARFTYGWNASGRRAVGVATVGMLMLAGGATTVASIVADPGQGAAQIQIEAGRQAVERQAVPPSDTKATEESTPAALPGGDQITAIGDSVMLASATELQNAFPGIHIDATVSRQLAQAPQIVESMLAAGTLRPTVVIGLGTNGPIDMAVLARLRELAGAEHQIVLVNVFAPRWWTDGVNANLSEFAQQYRDVELANWRDSISGQLRLLAGDQIHPGNAGGRVYVGAVRDALQRLSELPPLLGPRDYGLAPLPT